MPGVSFDRVASQYDDSRGGLERGTDQAAVLLPWLPDRGLVVDVGVGTGVVAAAVGRGDRQVFGVDLSMEMLRRAVERVPGRVVAGDALALPLRDESAAAAYIVHVLQLVSDVTATLAEAHRVVVPRGRLLVICGTGGSSREPLAVMIDELRNRLSGPRADDPDDVAALAASVGFVEVHREDIVRMSSYSVADLARSLEARVWSWTWKVDESQWQQHAEPVIAELLARPDAETVTKGADVKTLLVFEKR